MIRARFDLHPVPGEFDLPEPWPPRKPWRMRFASWRRRVIWRRLLGRYLFARVDDLDVVWYRDGVELDRVALTETQPGVLFRRGYSHPAVYTVQLERRSA